MKALVLNGSPPDDTSIETVDTVLCEVLRGRGWETESILLHTKSIFRCKGCFDCWVKTPGICGINDDGREVTRRMVRSGLLVFLTPIVFGGYSSELKQALDRSIPMVSPFFMTIDGEVHHAPRYARHPILLGVGVLSRRDKEAEGIFTALVGRNAINFHSPSHAARVVLSTSSREDLRESLGALVASAGGAIR